MAAGALAETVVEEVATNLEEVAEATRRINALAVKYTTVGMVAGFAVGFYFGHKLMKAKIHAEVLKEAEEQIEQIREYYKQRITREEKPDLEQIVEERGYATEPERLLRPPVPIIVQPPVVVIDGTQPSEDPDWIWPREMASRSPEQPYIIHEQEFMGNETGYSQTQYMYYAGDNMLVDTDDKPVVNGDQIVGPDNLRFGHGSEDANVVFVRNEKLELEMEIARDPGSFEEIVLGKTRPDEDGLEHSSQTRPARKKQRHQRNDRDEKD